MDYETVYGICPSCKEHGVELCAVGGVCRKCHINLPWEDCVSRTIQAMLLLQEGHSRDDVLKVYPNAKI